MTHVLVSVPEHLLAEVYGLLLRDLGPIDATSADSGEAVAVRGNGAWTQAELAELSRRLTHSGGRAVLRTIATAGTDGKEVTYEELRAAAASAMGDDNFSFDQLRAQLAWISRYSKSIRGVKQWPIEFHDQGQALEKGQRYRYSMPRRVAEWWLDLEASS